MSGANGVLVGRRAELELLRTALDDVRTGMPRVVQVSGEQGIGKTRLISEVCVEAERSRFLVLSGQATEFEKETAFGVVIDAMDDCLASLDRHDVEHLDIDVAELAGVFPALACVVEQPAQLLSAERYHAHRAVRALLDALSARRPMVLAYDDVHWADTASVELLSLLLRRPPRGPVLIVMAFRPAQLPKHFEAALDESTRTPHVLRLDLAPLTKDQARELLGALPPGAASDDLYRLSGGNPFYREQLALAGSAAGAEAPSVASANGPASIPAAVHGVLATEIAALSPGARALIQGAAVVGDPFEVGLAAAVAEVPEGEAFATLDELLDTDLVRPAAVPRRVAFRHPLVRHAVYQSTPAGWRIGAHARATAFLARQGAAPVSRARHVEHSACPGDVAAAAVLIDAAEASAGRAPAAAAHWYEAALRVIPDTDREARLAVLVALAPILEAVGRLEASHAALLQALEIVP